MTPRPGVKGEVKLVFHASVLDGVSLDPSFRVLKRTPEEIVLLAVSD